MATNTRPITTLLVNHWQTEDPALGHSELDEHFRKQGYLRNPYHFTIKVDGTIEHGRPESMAGAVDSPQASTSINIMCIIGPTGQYTGEQRKAVDDLVYLLKKRYPNAELETTIDAINQ